MRHRSLAVAAGLTFVLALSARAEFPFAGAAPSQTIGQTRGGVDRGSYNQIIELAPTLFSVNVQPPGQSGLVNAVLQAQLEATSGAQRRMIMDGSTPHRPARDLRGVSVQADALHHGRGDGGAVMRRLVAALGLLALGAGRSGAQGTFLVGAARVDVTPPPFDAAADAAM